MELEYGRKDGQSRGKEQAVWDLAYATIQYFRKYRHQFKLSSQFVNSIEYGYSLYIQGKAFSDSEFVTFSCQVETIASELLVKTYPLAGTEDYVNLQKLVNAIEPPQAPYPCLYSPGSKQKIEIMRWRAENGYQVFHDDDFTGEYSLPNYDGYLKLYGKIMEPKIKNGNYLEM